MPVRLFTFVQMELPWELGPPDGRYLLRKPVGPGENEPRQVIVLATVGAERRGLLGRRTRTRRADPEPEPAPVPVTRATVIDPVPLSAESQARAWLDQLDPEREAQAAADVLNQVLFAHRVAGATPHIHEVSPAQALVIRAGFGEGEHVADGLWMRARELLLSGRRARRRASVLRPQERLAAMLAGRESHLLCEELVLRARLDLDGGRIALAAIELERAYSAALGELPGEERQDLRVRIEELAQLRDGVVRAARAALPTSAPTTDVTSCAAADASAEGTNQANTDAVSSTRSRLLNVSTAAREQPEEQTIRHALERLEAALRARTARGSNLR